MTIYSLPSLLALLLAAALWWRYAAFGDRLDLRSMRWVLGTVVVWTALHLMRTLAEPLGLKMALTYLIMPAAVAFMVALLVWAAITTRIGVRLVRRLAPVLILVPIAVLVLAILPETRRWIWFTGELVQYADYTGLRVTLSPGGKVLVAVSALACIPVAALFAVHALRNKGERRRRSILLGGMALTAVPTVMALRWVWQEGITPVNYGPVGFMAILVVIALLVPRRIAYA